MTKKTAPDHCITIPADCSCIRIGTDRNTISTKIRQVHPLDVDNKELT